MRQVLHIAYYEFLHILKDPILLILVFLAPVAYATLFGVVYYDAVIKDIPLAIVDLDNSTLSQEISTAFANDESFKVITEVQTYEQLEKAMQEGKVKAGIVIPENFASKMYRQQKTEILSIYDASNLVWGYNIRKNVRPVIEHINDKHIKNHLANKGFTPKKIEEIMNACDSNLVTWYNPTYSYNNFLFLGLMMMVVHQIGLLSSGLTITREKEHNSWIQYLSSSIENWKIVLGKCIPYLIASFFNYTLLLWISSYFLSVKVIGSPLLLATIGFLFAVIVTFTGFAVSLYAPNSLQVTRYIMLLSIPLFIISGFTWPVTHIPEGINWLARIMPYTWISDGVRLISVKDVGFAEVRTNFIVLTIIATVAVSLAFNFKKSRKLVSGADLAVNNSPEYPRKHR